MNDFPKHDEEPEEEKTEGTRITDEFRPEMNKVSDDERHDLMGEAMRLIYGGNGNAYANRG